MMTPLPPQADDSRSLTSLRGILFRCTIRGGHATLAIIPSATSSSLVDDKEEEDSLVMIVVQMGGGQWNNHKESFAGSNDVGSCSSSSEQFASNIVEMRSNIRRMCKLGNELEFIGTFTNPSNNNGVDETASTSTDNKKDWTTWRKFTVNYNLQSLHSNIKVSSVGKWDAAKCQRVRCKFFNDSSKQKQQQPAKKKRREDAVGGADENNQQHSSTKGKQKRMQGEILADFVLWMLSTIIHDNGDGDDNMDQAARNNEWISAQIGLKKLPTDQNYAFVDRWKPLHPSLASDYHDASVKQSRNKLVAEWLGNNIINQSKINSNQDEKANPHSFALGGILDAAGGAGHVSLALSLRGIHSTVVDPRPTIGKLPGRDRKAFKKSKSKVSFSTYRAWFGSKPKGVDTIYREGRTSLETFLPDSERGEHNPLGVDDDGQQLPICSMDSNDKLLPHCAAIVALHPDEATGVIVETAVQNKIPFGEICFCYFSCLEVCVIISFVFIVITHNSSSVVLPCCVFSRLFPERKRRQGGLVSTYYELIDWLIGLHPAICVTTLPFEGANIAIWATFQ